MNYKYLNAITRLFSLSVLITLWISSTVIAQQVEGVVTDAETGETLAGVNILVQGTDMGTATNLDGYYELDVPSLDETLVFSYVGYHSQEVSIGGQSVINVEMEMSAFDGEELVVVGYGEIRRSDLTGSISSVSAEKINQIPTTNVMEGLQGRVPGMDITRSSGQPGSGVSITIRGNRSLTASNSPLFIVDGIQYGSIQDINPADIISIDVLKDASSTAIYGSRGANGVVLISTRQAEAGRTQVNVSSELGVNSVYAYPDIMTGPQYADRAREAARTQGNWTSTADDANIFSPRQLDYIESGEWTDYRDLLIQPGLTQDHQIGISTGTENTRAYLSLNYFDEQGILEMDRMQRYTARLNVDQRINNSIRVGMNTQITSSDHDRHREPFNMANKIDPLHSSHDADGNVIIQPTDRDINPLADMEPNAYEDNQLITRIFPTLYAEITPSENFSFRTNLSGTFTDSRRGQYRASATIDRSMGSPQAVYNTSKGRGLSVENIATYQTQYGNHSLTLTGIQSYMNSKNEFGNLQGMDQLLDSHLYYGLINATSGIQINSGYTESSLSSYAGRINYGWNHRYLFTLTGRYDGSSVLADGNQWAFFPSAAFAWRLIEEDFMRNASAFSDLKLRLSWGISGNDAISAYSTQSTLTRIPFAYGNTSAPGFVFSNVVGNPDLEWELSTTTNIGLDIGLWGNRLYAAIDVYNTHTTNLLLDRVLPLTSGVRSVVQNVGETRNRGIEVALSSENIRTPQFRWSSDLTFFANQEEIVELIGGEDNIANGWFIGHPTQVFYDYEYDGIWQESEANEAASYGQAPGHVRVVDQNNNGSIEADEDRVILGTTRPKWSGGLDNSFNFRNFDFNFYLYARVGQMMNYSLYSTFKDGPQENGARVDYWTPENTGGRFPRPGNNTQYRGTLNYEPGSFLKLRSVTLGYTLPASISDRISVNSLRVYVTGRNLFTLTHLDDYDPERGGAYSSPMTRLFVTGVNFQF